MTTRSQKRKAVAELVSGDFEASLAENISTENIIASSSKNPRLELKNLKEIKTTLRKEIMSDLTKILAENQKEMFKLIAPLNKKQTVHLNVQDSDSEPENVSVTRTSTPVKTHTATNSKTTPVNSRNRPHRHFHLFFVLRSCMVCVAICDEASRNHWHCRFYQSNFSSSILSPFVLFIRRSSYGISHISISDVCRLSAHTLGGSSNCHSRCLLLMLQMWSLLPFPCSSTSRDQHSGLKTNQFILNICYII